MTVVTSFFVVAVLSPAIAYWNEILQNTGFVHQCKLDEDKNLTCPSAFIFRNNVFHYNKIVDKQGHELIPIKELGQICNGGKSYRIEYKILEENSKII